MGSPDRFDFGKCNGFGLGFYYAKFPYEHTLNFNLLFWHVSIGVGKAHDETL